MSELNELVQQLKEINLKEFIERTYNVKFNGDDKSVCILPNHNENTGSLKYYKDSNTVTCFGCDELRGSNIFEVVGKVLGIDVKSNFVRIIRTICELEDIEFIERQRSPEDSMIASEIERKTKVAQLYKRELQADTSGNAYTYLLDRGLTPTTISYFHIGKTSQREQMYGIAGISNRLSIPIMKENGKGVKAISFRKIEEDELDTSPKYIHDRNDLVWNKGRTLYGFPYAIDEIRKTKKVVIVEGYFDLMSLYQIGIKNVVSIMGSVITDEQISMLKSSANHILYLKDNDEAGHKGFISTLPKLLKEGFTVDVVKDLGYKCKDANDLCMFLKWDVEKIKAFLKSKTIDGVLYYMSESTELYKNIVWQSRLEVSKIASDLLENIDNEVIRDNYKHLINKNIEI